MDLRAQFSLSCFYDKYIETMLQIFFGLETKWLTQVTTFQDIARSAKHHTHYWSPIGTKRQNEITLSVLLT